MNVKLAAFGALGLLCLASLSAQSTTTNRFLQVSVTDSNHRFVTGLDQQHFQVMQNGVSRTITSFSDVDAPMTIAVVADVPIAGLKLDASDQLIQTQSLADAIRQLVASKYSRKALVMVTPSGSREGSQSIPGGILALNVDKTMAEKAVIEVRNQYMLGFVTDRPEDVEVSVTPPAGLPVLKSGCLVGCKTNP